MVKVELRLLRLGARGGWGELAVGDDRGGARRRLGDRARLKAIVAGSVGNLIEWYDFYIYAFASLTFAGAFFPGSDRTAQLLGTSSIFAIGFFMRPLGSWYFGRRADRHGRRGAMLASIALMGIGSAFIAVLPTYAEIGLAAPALLLVGRMVQGFSTGGQYGTAATYLSEIAPPTRRGFFASFQYVTLIGGQLLAVVVLQLLQLALPAGAMATIGWRLAFALGAAAAAAMLLWRGAIHESAATTRSADAGRLSALLPHWRAFAIVLGLTAGGSLIFYVYSTYMQKYLVNTAHLPPATVNAIMTAVLIPFMALQPLFGALSDRIGRRANLVAFAALASLTTAPLLGWLGEVRSPLVAFALVLAGLAVNSLYTSVSGLFKAELFPLHVRALGVGLAYGIGNALFGGTAEAVALAFKARGHEGAFAWYATAICLLSLATALAIRRQDTALPA